MIARLRQRLPLALSLLAVALVAVPAFAHGVKHAKFAHNADKLDGKTSSDFYAKGSKVADSNKLDGVDSTGFYAAGSKVDDSDELDGFDSSVFRSRIDHVRQQSSECDTPNVDNFCATMTLDIPVGQYYRVSVWSSASWTGPAGGTNVFYCSARAGGPGQEAPSCITPFAPTDMITTPAGVSVSAASSGETTIGEGVWQVGTLVHPAAEFPPVANNGVITKAFTRNWDAESKNCGGPNITLC